jgi:acyl-coenzyme A synthetase/AMP-(fatty) acid ligase
VSVITDAPRTAYQLDAAFLAMVADWRSGGIGCDETAFDAHARALFEHQVRHNEPYARFAATCGFSVESPPATWREIPAVPSSAFKDATIATFDPDRAELEFHTSGTTADRSGKHFVARAGIYDASLAAGFDRFMVSDRTKLRFLNFVPNPRFFKHSSLGYMVGHVSVLRGDGRAGYFLDGEAIDVAGFVAAYEAAIKQAQPVCITGTAFALVALLETLEAERRSFSAPRGSRIMETGGFKGRTRAVARAEFYARLEATLGVPQTSIVAEYGMTELLSQYYDTIESRSSATRIKVAPPWLRTLVVDAAGAEVATGETGFLRHFDLANRSSVVAVQTEDLGYAIDGGIVLLGRELDAPPRGCSLDAEDLLALRNA